MVGGDKVEGATFFGAETVVLGSGGGANATTSREEARQIIKARDGIEHPDAVSKVEYSGVRTLET